MKAHVPPTAFDLQHYVRLLARQKWFLIWPAVAMMALVGIYSLSLTNLYKATSTVLVEPQAIPREFLKSTVASGPETYVRTLVEQVKSMSRLEQVIKEFELYSDRAGRPIEETVSLMRERIEIVRRGNDTFSITFIGPVPEKVAAVTNRLADLFIEENLKFRLQQSENNVELLRSQAEKLRAEATAQDGVVQKFKAEHVDSLPEQRSSVQLQLTAAQQQLEVNNQALVSARIRLSSLQDRVRNLRPTITTTVKPSSSPERRALEAAKEDLARLKLQYSEKHPDVRARQAEVAALSAAVAQSAASEAPATRRVTQSAERRRADEELALLEAEVARLEGEQERIKNNLETFNQRLEAMPMVELELRKLENGLKVKVEQADEYLKKVTDAAASLEMERRNQGSAFRSLDRAQVPSAPISPNRPFMVVLGAVAGLTLGILLMVLLDVLFRPFLDAQDLAHYASIQVLVSIPQVGPFPSEWDRFRSQISNLLGFMLGSFSFGTASYERRAEGISPAMRAGAEERAVMPVRYRGGDWQERRTPASREEAPGEAGMALMRVSGDGRWRRGQGPLDRRSPSSSTQRSSNWEKAGGKDSIRSSWEEGLETVDAPDLGSRSDDRDGTARWGGK